MSNPLALLPIALAAGGGAVDSIPASRLVAAGFTLLQRSAPLVRALAGQRSAILLPPSPAVLTALAASDGRGAVLLPTPLTSDYASAVFSMAGIGAVFTTHALAAKLPVGKHAVVVLDDLPRTATVIAHGTEQIVDLGSHFGLDLAGEDDVGRDEECLMAIDGESQETLRPARLTHRTMFTLARSCIEAGALHAGDRVLSALPIDDVGTLSFTMLAPLLVGAQVVTLPRYDAAAALHRVESGDVTVLIGTDETFGEIADLLEGRQRPLMAPTLRACIYLADRPNDALAARWRAVSGVALRTAAAFPHAAE